MTFTDEILCLINTWEALQIAIENTPGCSNELRLNLVESIVEYIHEQQGRVDVDDMIVFFDAFFEDVFEVSVEDGSIEILSERVLQLYSTYRNNNSLEMKENSPVEDSNRVEAFNAVDESNTVKASITVDESNILVESTIEIDITNNHSITSSDQQDDDGWTLVTKNSRRRK